VTPPQPGSPSVTFVYDYDLVVIGCGPGGQKAAIAAAKLGKRAVVVESCDVVGGACINTGTIPSKTLRETVVYLTGLSQREMYGQSYRVKSEITMDDLTARTAHVVSREIHVVQDQLARNHVQLMYGRARLVDAHAVAVQGKTGETTLTAQAIVVATGTRPARPENIAFDGHRVLDSDGILCLQHIPGSLVVVGAGVIGIEYASIFAALGCKVTVVERRDRMLEFCDEEVTQALQYHLRGLAVTFRFRETVAAVELHGDRTLTVLASGKTIAAEAVMYSAGRSGATEGLGLQELGIAVDPRGRIAVDGHYRTSVPNIYAVGDVIGFPALAATSMEQGRLAAYHAFGEDTSNAGQSALMPIGIYTIPEISYCGRTEAELTDAAIPYEIGVSRHRELARGQIAGDSHGMLKLLVSTQDRKLLGVHVFGTGATETVHIGQAVMGCGGTVDYLVDTVFNYPTLAEAYKVAALDVTNKMRTVRNLRPAADDLPRPLP
jgi:NAD(P) transhydrogenase